MKISRVYGLSFGLAALCVNLAACEGGSKAPVDHRYDAQATHNIQTALHLDFHESMYHSARITGNTCTAFLERAKYDDAGSDGQATIQRFVRGACSSSYRYVLGHRRPIPYGGLTVVIKDLSSRELFSDSIVDRDATSEQMKAPKRQALKVAYTVGGHYVWDCSSNGGSGRRRLSTRTDKETSMRL